MQLRRGDRAFTKGRAALRHDPDGTREGRSACPHAETAGLPGLAVLVGLYTAAKRSEIASSVATDRRRGTNITLDRPRTRDVHTVPMRPRLAEHLEERRVPASCGLPGPAWRAWLASDRVAVGCSRSPRRQASDRSHQLRHTALTAAYDATRICGPCRTSPVTRRLRRRCYTGGQQASARCDGGPTQLRTPSRGIPWPRRLRYGGGEAPTTSTQGASTNASSGSSVLARERRAAQSRDRSAETAHPGRR